MEITQVRVFPVDEEKLKAFASIIFDGYCIRSSPSTSPLPANTRLAINVIAADVSPDLRNARVTVSVISSPTVDAAAKREAFAWLAANAGPIRHACAQRLSHMKTVPELTFKMTDVGAAVDVMSELPPLLVTSFPPSSLPPSPLC